MMVLARPDKCGLWPLQLQIELLMNKDPLISESTFDSLSFAKAIRFRRPANQIECFSREVCYNYLLWKVIPQILRQGCIGVLEETAYPPQRDLASPFPAALAPAKNRRAVAALRCLLVGSSTAVSIEKESRVCHGSCCLARKTIPSGFHNYHPLPCDFVSVPARKARNEWIEYEAYRIMRRNFDVIR